MRIRICLFLILAIVITTPVTAATKLKPFILAEVSHQDMAGTESAVKSKLGSAGFDIVGEYTPYQGVKIIAISNASLKEVAGSSEHGGYAAVMRVALTQGADGIQVSFNNPVYLSHAYRLEGELSTVTSQLKNALGFVQEFGSDEGLSAEELRKYHYTFGMEYFDEPSELGEFDSYKQAVAAVEQGLAASKGGVTKVYRVDIPGKDETVFGVAMSRECSGDKFIMGHIDFKPTRSSAHLPYEILVSDKQVYALFARFRIAIDFPDLKMMGANSFMKIMCAPGEIEDALEEVIK